jgi:hypothetical protein
MNNIFRTNQLILKIIDQYDVKHIMKLPIKTTMSNLKDLTTLSLVLQLVSSDLMCSSYQIPY